MSEQMVYFSAPVTQTAKATTRCSSAAKAQVLQR